MSNEMTIFSNAGGMPAIPQDLMGAFGKSSLFDIVRKGGGTSKRISIRGNKFRMEIGGEEISAKSGHIDVVILGCSPDYLRQYYSKPYDPKDTSPPDCWSNDNKTPHENSASPQSSTCLKCPKNIAGSGIGTTKACQTKSNIAVVLANNIEGGDIFEMTIPATSLFNKFDPNTQRGGLLGYAGILDKKGVDPRLVVTRIAFDEDSATPLLWFSGVNYVASEHLRTIVEKSESEETQHALVFHYRKPSDDATAAPARAATPSAAPAPKPSAAKPKPAPVAQEPEPAPAEEPAQNNPAMAKAAALLDEWGEDV
jgi:hypothetical protein